MKRLRRVLGEDAAFLALPLGRKNPGKDGWDECRDDLKLARSNIAVLLGHKHRNLCSLDFDDDLAAEEFLRINPNVGKSLRSQARRGCNIWIRLLGQFPKTKHLKHRGETVGEFRSDGGYTVIQGKHPEGVDYKILVNEPVVSVSLSDLKWLDGRSLAEVLLCHTETQNLRNAETQDVVRREQVGVVHDHADLITRCIPTRVHQTNQMQFKLARLVKAREMELGVRIDLFEVHRVWYSLSVKFLRSDKSEEDYLMEFLQRYNCVKTPDTDPVDLALELAAEKDPPRATLKAPEGLRNAAKICRELARIGKGRFFLSARDLQRVLKLGDPKAAHRLLAGLQSLSVIKLVEKGSLAGRKASVYDYLAED